MDKIYKKIYITLSIVMIMFVAIFTIVNVFYYASIVQINVPILSFILIFPLFNAFKFNKYSKKVIVFLGSILSIVMIWTLILFPDYTYNDAVKMISKEDETLKIQVKRITGKSDFFYSGNYYIESKDHKYSFDFKTGKHKIIE